MARDMLPAAICLVLLAAALQCANSQQGKPTVNPRPVHVYAFLPTAEPSCNFKYLQQPPSTTLSNCNPYTQSQHINIALECLVRRARTTTDSYEIKWFRENTNGTVEDLGFVQETGSANERRSRYHDEKLLHKRYSPSLLGKYWCQVVNTSANPDKLLMRSNVFTLLAPGDYSGITCYGHLVVQIIPNESCADLNTTKPGDHLTTHMQPTAVKTTTSVITTSLEASHDRHSSLVTTPPSSITTIQYPIATPTIDLTPSSTANHYSHHTAVSPTLSHQQATTTTTKTAKTTKNSKFQ